MVSKSLSVIHLLVPMFSVQLAASRDKELSPVCAVVGGVVAAEVIKIIGAKEVCPPIRAHVELHTSIPYVSGWKCMCGSAQLRLAISNLAGRTHKRQY